MLRGGEETWPLHSCTPLHPLFSLSLFPPCTGNCNQVRSWAGFWWCCLLYVWVSLVPGVCVSFGDLSYGGGQSGSACCTRSDHPWPEAHALPFFSGSWPFGHLCLESLLSRMVMGVSFVHVIGTCSDRNSSTPRSVHLLCPVSPQLTYKPPTVHNLTRRMSSTVIP